MLPKTTGMVSNATGPGPRDATISRDAAGTALGWAAVACLVLMAPVMAVAHRSTPLTLTLAALFALGSVLVEGRARRVAQDLGAALLTPAGLAVAAFLAWALLSTAWSPAPRRSLFAWGEFALPLAAGLVTLTILPGQMGRLPTYLLAAGLALAAVIVLADLATGMVYRGQLGMRVAAFVLNRPALVLLVLLPVAAWLLWRERQPVLALALVLVVAAAIMRTESGAAKLGLLAEAAGAAVALAWRRLAVVLTGAAVLLALAVSPVVGDLAERALPPGLYVLLGRAHAQDRVDIWRSFGAALRERPLAGYGFDASARMPAPAGLAPDFAALLPVGHPHDAALQIWVELGAVGCFLAALVACFAVRALWRLPRGPCAVAVAIVAAALADSLVGQGAWQGWWPAALAAALVWLGYSRARDGTGTYAAGE